jgi:hypothetical protein
MKDTQEFLKFINICIQDIDRDKDFIPRLKRNVKTIRIPKSAKTKLPSFSNSEISQHGNWEKDSHEEKYIPIGRMLQDYTDLLTRFFKKNVLHETEFNKLNLWNGSINELCRKLFKKKYKIFTTYFDYHLKEIMEAFVFVSDRRRSVQSFFEKYNYLNNHDTTGWGWEMNVDRSSIQNRKKNKEEYRKYIVLNLYVWIYFGVETKRRTIADKKKHEVIVIH